MTTANYIQDLGSGLWFIIFILLQYWHWNREHGLLEFRGQEIVSQKTKRFISQPD